MDTLIWLKTNGFYHHHSSFSQNIYHIYKYIIQYYSYIGHKNSFKWEVVFTIIKHSHVIAEKGNKRVNKQNIIDKYVHLATWLLHPPICSFLKGQGCQSLLILQAPGTMARVTLPSGPWWWASGIPAHPAGSGPARRERIASCRNQKWLAGTRLEQGLSGLVCIYIYLCVWARFYTLHNEGPTQHSTTHSTPIHVRVALPCACELCEVHQGPWILVGRMRFFRSCTPGNPSLSVAK